MPDHYRDKIILKDGELDWCKHCERYTKSHIKNIDTLSFKLSGRKGKSIICDECNREVAFLGIIS